MGAALGPAHEGGYVVQAANAAAGAQRGAVEGCHGIGEIERLLHRHGLQNSIAERPVKDVAGTGGIHTVDDESGGVVELAVLAGEGAVGSQGHGGDADAVLFLDGFEGFEGIGFAGPGGGKFAGGDEVIDVGEDAVEALIDGIDVDGDGDAVAAGDFGGAGDGGGIVAVDVEDAGAGDHVLGDLLGVDLEAIVAAPEDGALAGGAIDDDVGGLIGTAAADQDVVEVDAGALEAFDLDAAAEVVADRADVLGAQAEAGAGYEGAGDLAAGAEVFFFEGHLAGVGREVRNDEQGISGIEAHSNDVEFR